MEREGIFNYNYCFKDNTFLTDWIVSDLQAYLSIKDGYDNSLIERDEDEAKNKLEGKYLDAIYNTLIYIGELFRAAEKEGFLEPLLKLIKKDEFPDYVVDHFSIIKLLNYEMYQVYLDKENKTENEGN